MRKTRKQLKKSAIRNMTGHYALLIGALLFSLLVSLLLNIPFSNMISQGVAFGVPFRIIVGILGEIIVLLIAILLYYGTQWIHLRIARGWKSKFIDLFYPFINQSGKFLGFGLLEILIGIICLLPGVLCLLFSVVLSSDGSFSFIVTNRPLMIAGHFVVLAGAIIFVRILFSWCLSAFLMLEHQDLRVMSAISQSRQLMKKNRWRRLVLMLSFVGWLFFSILSLFIALLWIIPYYSQSITCFYIDLQPDAPPDPDPKPETENSFHFRNPYDQ